MGIIIGLLIAGLAIAGFIIYWAIVLTLFALAITFTFWRLLFTQLLHDPAAGLLCAVVATGLTIWAFSAYSSYRDNQRQSEGLGENAALLVQIQKENRVILILVFALVCIVGFGLM
jgi:membrane protein implicated in regulation of membrane protease activity